MRNTSTVPSYSFDKETGWRLDLPMSIVPGTRVLCLYRVSTTKQLYHDMNDEADIPMAQAMQQQYNLFGIQATAASFPIEPLPESIPFFQVLHTPGHTPGSICLYRPEEGLLLSGDTLFRMGYGRTDLPGGHMGQLMESLETLFTLPSGVRVYPGHGEFTTIGAENNRW